MAGLRNLLGRRPRPPAIECAIGVGARVGREGWLTRSGVSRTWKALLRAGETAPHCEVRRLMKAHGIRVAKRRGRPWKTTRPDPLAHRRAGLVERHFTANAPNELWLGDLTYLRCWEGCPARRRFSEPMARPSSCGQPWLMLSTPLLGRPRCRRARLMGSVSAGCSQRDGSVDWYRPPGHGALIALGGLAIIRDAAADTATRLEGGVRRKLAELRMRRTVLALRIRVWWARRRGRTIPANPVGTADAHGSMTGSLTTTRKRVDPATVGKREWLAYLDEHLDHLFKMVESDRVAVHARIDESRKQLRDEIAAATIEGWQLAVVGICIGIVGTIIGGFA
jgi:hypothetical protein